MSTRTSNGKPMPYGPDFQKSVLRLMMVDPVFCARAMDQLKKTDFEGELSWFFDVMKENYEGQLPSKDLLMAEITKHPAARQIIYTNILNEILSLNPDTKVIVKEMTGFIQANIFIESCLTAANLYNSNKTEEAYAVVTDRVAKLNKVSFGTDGNTRFDEGASELARKAMAERAGAIPTGIHKIDDAMGGGLLPGTWTTFLGPTNAGKSMLMPSLAKQAALKGKRTFVTIHEDEEIPTKIRYLACFADIPYQRLAYEFGCLTPEELKRVGDAEILLKHYVILRFMYTTDSTVERVMDEARLLMKTEPFDLYLCDYGQCLTSSAFKKLDSVRHQHEHVYHMLKQLCLELKIPGAGGAQVNREANKFNEKGYDYIRTTDVAEAFGIVKKSSNVITMNRSAKDEKANRIVFLLDKCRNGAKSIAVECESDYASAQVYRTEPGKQVDVSNEISKGPAKRDPADDDSKSDYEKKRMTYA